MSNEEEVVEIEYSCDSTGNHKAPITACLDVQKRKFSSLSKAIPFIEECSYVYNLDALFINAKQEDIPVSLQGLVCNSLTCN